MVGGSNPSRDTKVLWYDRQTASGECVGVTLSNYSPVAAKLNDYMKLRTSVFGMLLM